MVLPKNKTNQIKDFSLKKNMHSIQIKNIYIEMLNGTNSLKYYIFVYIIV